MNTKEYSPLSKTIIGLLTMMTILASSIISADPGGTDENEGHYNQKTGEYHYHRKITPLPEQDNISMQRQAITQANIDAVSDADQNAMWYGAGFLFGIFGVGAAYVATPSVPTIRLMGKSPEYIIFYTDTYKQAARDRHVEQATSGCIAWAGVLVIYYLFSTGQI